MKETVYFGTYTRRTSQGIYKADFDTETGQLSHLKLFANEPSPTYLALDDANHLYTVGSKDGQGGIAAYQTDGTLLNHVVEEGAPHCYISVDDKRNADGCCWRLPPRPVGRRWGYLIMYFK